MSDWNSDIDWLIDFDRFIQQGTENIMLHICFICKNEIHYSVIWLNIMPWMVEGYSGSLTIS